MAFKGSLLMLSCFLLVATEVYGSEALQKPLCDPAVAPAPAHSSPANASSPAPAAKAPTSSPPAVYPTPQAPTMAPMSSPPAVYPTPQAPTMAPTSTPVYPTPQAPTPSLPGNPSSRTHLRYCVPECQRRCTMLRDAHKEQHLKIRPCVHVCTACCEKHRPLCVPSTLTTCTLWTTVLYHNGIRTCP